LLAIAPLPASIPAFIFGEKTESNRRVINNFLGQIVLLVLTDSRVVILVSSRP